MFDFRSTKFYNTLTVEPLFKIIKPFKWLSFAVVAVSIAGYIFYAFASAPNKIFLTIIYIFVLVLVVSLCIDSFFENWVKRSKNIKKLSEADITNDTNLAEYLNYESIKYLYSAFSLGGDGSQISSSKLLYNLLDKKNKRISFIFSRLLIDIDTLRDILYDFSKRNENIIDCDVLAASALISAIKRGGATINEGDIICALAEIEPNFKKILVNFQLKKSDLENLNWWIEYVFKKNEFIRKFWEYDNLIRAGSVGGDWACGWSSTLDQYSFDWSNSVRAMGYEESIGHEEQVALIEDSLTKRGNKNVLIVGEIGSGRKSVVYQLIRKSIYDRSLPEINGKKFLQLDLVSLVSSIESSEKVEAVLDMCFKEAIRAGNIILIINDLHEFLGGSKAGIVDISGILIPHLNNPDLQMICLTSYSGLHKNIESKPAILQEMAKIEIPELTPEETMLILQGKVFSYEHQYKKFISYQALTEIIKTSQKYISDPFPQKAIELMEEAFAYSDTKGISDVIEIEDVDFVITKKTDIPIGAVNSQEKILLLNMEQELHKRVVSQNDAIREISSALRRARSGVQIRKGPMGAFLFLGPTGVGKTETAKAVAEIYFGAEDKMIRIDMSEFQRTEDIPRLMGSQEQPGILTTKVRESPFSLVLLDEFEKAHPDILNLFLQVIDEGYLNDNFGQKVSFTNTIIVATSNAGYQIILDSIKTNKPMEEVKDLLLDNIFQKGIFRPELVNRFDGLIVFKPLTQDDLMQIAQMQLNKLKKRLFEKEIDFIITEELKKKIVELSYDPVFGAREMRRVIQEKVEDCLAREFLGEKIKNGAVIEINPNDFTLKIKNPE